MNSLKIILFVFVINLFSFSMLNASNIDILIKKEKILFQKAIGAEKKGNYHLAVSYLEKSLSLNKKIFGNNSIHIAENFNTLGLLYIKLGEYSKAMEYSLKALKTRKKILVKESFNTDDRAEFVSSLDDNNKILLFNSIRKYSKALKHYQISYIDKVEVHNKENFYLAEIYTSIGLFYYTIKDYLKALLYFEKAVKVRKEILDNDYLEIANDFSNISLIYNRMGIYNKAREYQKKALDIWRQPLKKGHTDIAETYTNIGLFYFRIVDNSKALEYFKKALMIREKTLGKEHTDTVTSYINIGYTYNNMGYSDKALEYFKKAMAIREKLLHQEHFDTVKIYSNIGFFYYMTDNYPEALEYYEKTLAIQKKTLSKEHLGTIAIYDNIGMTYSHMADYSKALEYFEKVLKIHEETLKKDHPDIIDSYNKISWIYDSIWKKTDYTKALEYKKKALEILEKNLGEVHTDTINSYNNIGLIYEHIGNRSKALEYYKKALGKEYPDTADRYIHIGLLYKHKLNYSKTLVYYKKALTLQEKTLGKYHPNTAIRYSDISSIYDIMGNYPKAIEYQKKSLKYQEKALATWEKDPGEKLYDLAISYDGIGHFYVNIGDYPEALNYYKKAQEKREKARDTEYMYSPDFATSYLNIGQIYYYMRDYPKALKFQKKALEIREISPGKEYSDTAVVYTSIGLTYYRMEDYPKALEYQKKALVIFEKNMGKTHLDTANIYNNIGLVYDSIGDYIKALEFQKKALVINEKTIGKKHPNTAVSYSNISLIHKHIKNYPKAYRYAKISFDIFLKNRDQVFIILDSQQKDKYLKSKSGYVALLLDISNRYLSQLKKEKNTQKSQQLLQSSVNIWFNYKGSIFDSENTIAMLYASTEDAKLKAKIDDLISAKRYLAKLYQSLPKPKEKNAWQNNIKTTEEKIATLTNDISSKASSFKEQQGLKSITYKDISSHLKENELYIDYAKAGEHYYIFSLDNKEKITFIGKDRNGTEEINSLLKRFREDITTILNKNKITDEELKTLTKSSKEKLSKLYKLLIKRPLGDILKNKTSLIISPDGALRLLPFEALYNKENGKYLIEEKEIRYIPSGKELIRLYKYAKEGTKQNRSTVIFANPNFNSKIASASKEEITITPNTSRSGIIKSLFRMRFAPLPGTKAEAKAIKATLNKNTVSEYQQNKATESTLMTIKEPEILHIATHGFFINDNSIQNPMLKSGIALAGANASAIKGKSDGIVTALKLSGLDLKGTDLVVLSACETGVVDINATDSVSGLSKAFIQAGAKDIVMSLWSVDDQATKELMTSFYQEMKENNNYAKALKAAKLKMIEEGRHPFYWAAFVVSGL